MAVGEAWEDHGLIFPSEVAHAARPGLRHASCSPGPAGGPASGTGVSTSCGTRVSSLMLAQGTDLYVVSEVLGHSSAAHFGSAGWLAPRPRPRQTGLPCDHCAMVIYHP